MTDAERECRDEAAREMGRWWYEAAEAGDLSAACASGECEECEGYEAMHGDEERCECTCHGAES